MDDEPVLKVQLSMPLRNKSGLDLGLDDGVAAEQKLSADYKQFINVPKTAVIKTEKY